MSVTNNSRDHQFEYHEGDQVALLAYAEYPGVIELQHTEVPPALGGKGVATELAHFALEYAKEKKRKVIVTCPFVRTYVKRHPEYQSLLQT